MGSLKIVNSIIRAVYYDNLIWRTLSKGFIASTFIPASHYKEHDVVHSVNILNQFLKSSPLDGQFRVFRTQDQQGQIIHITAHSSTSEHLRENKVTGLPGVMTKKHASLADALILPSSRSETYLHVEFPRLTQLKESADPEFMNTIQALVFSECWFTLALEPTVRVLDKNSPPRLLSEHLNSLGSFSPVRAEYTPEIISLAKRPLANATDKVTRNKSETKPKDEKAIIVWNNSLKLN